MGYLFKLIKVIFDSVEFLLHSSLKLALLTLDCLHTCKCLLYCHLTSSFLGVLGGIGVKLAVWIILGQDVANGREHILPASWVILMFWFDPRVERNVSQVFLLVLEIFEAEGSVGVWGKIRPASGAMPEGFQRYFLPGSVWTDWLVLSAVHTADWLPHKSPKYLIKINPNYDGKQTV